MIRCCYKCTDRWSRDGKTCHGTCQRYADAVAEDQSKKEAEREAKKSFVELCAYRKSHYKARDSHANRVIIQKKNRW